MSKRACSYLRTDAVMAELMDRVGPIQLRPRRLPRFQSLTHAIIHQQLSGKAAGTILERFQALFGSHAFPSPRGPGELAGAVAQRDVMTEQELLERFTNAKGIGRWTVEMQLIFNLGRPDVLPIHDLGVRKGFQFAYRKRKLPEPEQLARFGTRWAPHRTTAAWYLRRAADFLNGNDGW